MMSLKAFNSPKGFFNIIPSVYRKCFSSSASLVRTYIDSDSRVGVLTLSRPPVNSLSLEMCQAITSALKELESDKGLRALILNSGNPAVLSAGLDITELYQPDPKRLGEFWSSFQQVFLDLYGSRLATICAVEGHAPAGGCMLTLCCDYRIMTNSEKASIGLNETKLGITAPYWLADLMIRTIGFREADKAMALGQLYNPSQALEIGLVDELCEPSDVLVKAQEVASIWMKIPPHALVASKEITRKKYIDGLLKKRHEDIENFKDYILDDAVQSNLALYLENLKKKSNKK